MPEYLKNQQARDEDAARFRRRTAAGSTARSERYEWEIRKAQEAFAARMDRLPHVEVTDEMYEAGLDAMPQAWRDVQQEVFEERLAKGNYELSYTQITTAGFSAGYNGFKIDWVGPAASAARP